MDLLDLVNLGVTKVYVLTHTLNDSLLKSLTDHGIGVWQVANNQTVGDGITVQSVYDGSLSGIVVNTQSITFAIVLGNDQQTSNFVNIIPNADFYVVKTPTNNYFDQKLVTFSLYQDYCDTNYGANKYGNFTIKQKDGTMIVNF